MSSDQDLRAFELEHAAKAVKLSPSDARKLRESLKDSERDVEKRFYNYCILCAYHRRNKNNSEYFSLTNTYNSLFLSRPLHQLHRAIALHERGLKNDIQKSFELTETILNSHGEFVGALHFKAVILLTQYSRADEKSKNLLENALENVSLAIRYTPEYAKFYDTRARIYAKLGQYDRALLDIAEAIDKEDNTGKDYAIRLSDYFSTKTDIEVQTCLAKVEARITEIEEEAKTKNLEILSFFIVLATFMIGSFSLVTSLNFIEIIQVIFVLGAMALIAVGGFTLMFLRQGNLVRALAATIVAALLMFLAVLAPKFFENMPS